MEYNDELKRLGERFTNKNIGCGNPCAKILVVTQEVGNEEVDFKYLQRLFRNLPGTKGKETNVLDYCYYTVFDHELLSAPFFKHFQIILHTFIDGNQLHQHDPVDLFGLKWVSECTIEDGAIQRLFVAHSKAQCDNPEKVMFCTYPFEKVSDTIMRFYKMYLNWFYYLQADLGGDTI